MDGPPAFAAGAAGHLEPALSLLRPHLGACFSGWQQRIFRRRLLRSSVDGIRAALPDQESFVLQLSVEDFSKRLTYAPTGQTLTVEQAVQEFLLFYWRDQLRALRIAEGLRQAPGDLPR